MTCLLTSGCGRRCGERHQGFSADGTYNKIHAWLVAEADMAGDLDWIVSVDSTANRVHQHATNRT